MKTLAFILKVTISLLVSFACLWLLIWNGIEVFDYKLVVSENNMIAAFEYLINVLWVASMIVSPVIWMAVNYLLLKSLFKIDLNA